MTTTDNEGLVPYTMNDIMTTDSEGLAIYTNRNI